MTENWAPVLLDSGGYVFNGNNIVLQHTETKEIGYVEDTVENRQLFGVGEREVNENCSLVTVTQDEELANDTGKIEWGDETKLLLDLYYEYLPQVGPMKKFKSKKKMWEQISEVIYNRLKITRSAVQCESRFKTIKKRKTGSQSENRISGNSPAHVPYADEFNKIKSIDDSVQPEVLIDITHKIVNTKPSTSRADTQSICTQGIPERGTPECTPVKKCANSSKRKSDKLAETLLIIHKEKEESRERRHREKLELLEALAKKQKHCKCD